MLLAKATDAKLYVEAEKAEIATFLLLSKLVLNDDSSVPPLSPSFLLPSAG